MEQEFEFDEWFDLMSEKTRALGYSGPIDKYAFEWDWEEGKSPEQSAEEFVKEMND